MGVWFTEDRVVEGKCLESRRPLAVGVCDRELGHSPSVLLGRKARYFLMETDETRTQRDNELKQDSPSELKVRAGDNECSCLSLS